MNVSVADRRRWMSLVILCVGFLMIVLDQTIVNVALPSIQTDLGFSQSNLAWVVNAYLISFGGLLMLAGRLGDLVGRKRFYRGKNVQSPGTGLGLALVAQQARIHGGCVEVGESPLGGARFDVTLVTASAP